MKHILAMLLALLGASGALAQIYVKVVPEKKTFLSGEAMYMSCLLYTSDADDEI